MSKAKDKQAQTKTLSISDWVRLVLIGLCVIGIGIAGYMAWAELTGNETQCSDAGKIDCSAVQNSAYASTLGLPMAVLGVLGYVAILVVLVLEDQLQIAANYGHAAVVGMTLFGVILQTYLTVIEATVLDAWCQWCIASFVVITLVFIGGSYRMYAFLQPLRR
ncbi:MAG: vitamin K epoxide reductase family protein [Chloroflexi bacterium]|nr:vitamin K epoxide reductase family protein [Chloroflexota bacterium]